MNQSEVLKKISIIIGDVSPFLSVFSQASMRKVRFTQDIPFAAVNNKGDIFINESAFFSLPLNDQVFIIAHEMLHLILSHCFRRGDRLPYIWNVACDFVVNSYLVREGFNTPKKTTCLFDKQFEGLNAEEIYSIIIKDQNLKEKYTKSVDDIYGGSEFSDELCESEEIKNAEQEIKDLVYKAKQIQGAFGNSIGTEILSLVDAPAKINWISQLNKFLKKANDDFGSYIRNLFIQDIYVEELVVDKLSVNVCVDTSGSISTSELSRFISEIKGIIQQHFYIDLKLYYCDTCLRGPFSVSSLDFNNIIGGGGTSFIPFFEEMNKQKSILKQNDVYIYFTDGDGEMPPESMIPKNTIWVLTNKNKKIKGNIIYASKESLC